jgi:hypothetical protein
LEAELAVEILCYSEIRNGKMKMVNRVNAKLAWATGWLDESLDRRHRVSSGPDIIILRRPPAAVHLARAYRFVYHLARGLNLIALKVALPTGLGSRRHGACAFGSNYFPVRREIFPATCLKIPRSVA